MERSRRSQSSGDKRGTSLLIQQLAAARERKLQGGLAFTTQYKDLLEASEIELLDSDASSSEDIEDADSPASQPTRASPDRENPPATQRNRLVRKDKHKSSIPDYPTMNETVDDLASMIQGIGLSATSQPAGQEQQQQEYRFPSSRSNNSSLHDSGIGSAEQPQRRSGTSTDTHTKQQVISDTGEPAAPCERLSHKPPPQTSHPIKATALQDSNSDSEDEIATQIPRSRKPATATEHDSSIEHHSHQQRLLTHSSSNSAGNSKHVSGDSDQSDSDDDSGSSSTAAAGSGSSHPASSSSSRGGSNHRTAGSHSSSGSGSSSGGIRSYLEAKAPSAALEPAEGSLVLEGGFCLDVKIASKLYPHQLQGVKWLWSLHRMRKGGILADDMGLGKTMQCSAFLAGSLRSHQAIRALVIAPKTLLAHWEKELRVCGMAARTHCFYGSSEGERSAALRTLTGRGGVMLTTYGMVLHNAAQLRQGLGPVARDADEHEDELDFLCPDPPPGRRILWDYIILDEGHKIKNSRTQLAQRLRELRAMTRVIISGTPVQNNLSELHSLMDFAVPGLLGGAKEFKMIYEKAITAGQDRDASLRVRELGAAKAAELRKIVAPFMLRREKKEVLGSGSGTSTTPAAESSSGTSSASGVVAAAAVSSSGAAAGPAPMGSKHDLVVWLRLQPLQRHIYEAFLHSDAVKEALNSTKSPLAALTVLKKVCDHPALLSERATNLVLSAASKPHKQHPKASKTASKQRRNSLDDFIVDDDDETDDDTTNSDASGSDSDSGYINPNSYNPIQSKAAASRAAVAAELDDAGFSDEFITWAEAEGLENRLLSDVHQKGTEASCKSLFVTALLESLVDEGHRTLVFSQSRVMLDIVQAAVVARGWSYCRIDGSMASADARQAEVSRFQAPGADIPVFLLTTQVGGLGLTLTAANRVVIVDPSWNPATDNQSVDRAYRIGQTRDVVVYRLVTCGTVEEKIYRKQVFKGGLSKAGMEEGVQLRYFTHQELHELFKWDPAALSISETQQLLAQQHSSHTRKTLEQNPDLAKHLTWIEDFPLCAGTSEHGLLFSELDPEGKTLQITRPEYLTATAAQQGLVDRGPRGSRKGVGLSAAAAAAAGPSAAEISTMLSSLNIAGSSSSGNAGGATGSSSRMVAASDASSAAADQHLMLENRVRDLEISLQKVTADVNNLAARLPDGGVKLKARQAELQVALLAARTQLQQLPPPRCQPPSSASTISESAAAGGSAAGAVPSKQNALVDVTNGATAKPSPQQQQQQQQWKPRPPYEAQHPMQVQSQQQQQQQHLGQQLLQQQQGRCLPPSMQQQQQWPAHAGHHPQQQQDYYYQQQPPPPPPARQPQHMHHHQQQQRQHGEQQYHQQQNPQRQQQHHLGSLLLQQSQLGRRTVDPVKPGEQQQVADNSSRHLNPRSSTGSDSRVPHQSSTKVPDSGDRSQQSAKTAATTTAAVGPAVSAASDQLPPGLVAETLDGRVPTLSELRQRRHVLKKALQHEDKLKAQLRVEGRDYSPSRQQQWVMMYQEYKEIKQLLQKADELLAAGSSGGQAETRKAVETIDLT